MMASRRPFDRFSTGLVLLIAAGALLVIALPHPVRAQSLAGQPSAGQPRSGSIDLVDQSLAADGRLQLRLRLFDAAAATNIRVDLYREVEDREAFMAGLESVDRAELRLFPRTTIQLSQLDADADGAITLDVPPIESSPIALDPGVHPVVVTLRAGTAVVDSLTTYVVVEDPDLQRLPLFVALVAQFNLPIGLQPNQQSAIPDDDRTALLRQLTLISRRPDSRFTLDFAPELVTASIGRSDTELVDALRAAAAGNEVLKAPWVPLDEVPLHHAGLTQVVEDAYALGDRVFARDLDTTVVDMIRLDDDTRRADLPIMSTNTDYLLDLAQLSDRQAPPVYGPVLLNGSIRPALIVDQDLSNRIRSSTDAELAAAILLAELDLIATEVAATQSGVIIQYDLASDPALLELVVDAIAGSTELVSVPIDEIASLPILVNVDPPQRYLNPAPTADLQLFAEDLMATQDKLSSFATVVAPADSPLAPLRQLLLASVATNLSAPRHDYLDSISISVDAGLQSVTVDEPNRITLTSRRADLPITILNGQGLPLNVAIQIDSTSVDLDTREGEPFLTTLQPGPTEVDLPVHVRAAGDSTVNILVTSPDGRLAIATSSLDVRSTAISGLGLVISILALAVLLTWWIRSTLARRRSM